MLHKEISSLAEEQRLLEQKRSLNEYAARLRRDINDNQRSEQNVLNNLLILHVKKKSNIEVIDTLLELGASAHSLNKDDYIGSSHYGAMIPVICVALEVNNYEAAERLIAKDRSVLIKKDSIGRIPLVCLSYKTNNKVTFNWLFGKYVELTDFGNSRFDLIEARSLMHGNFKQHFVNLYLWYLCSQDYCEVSGYIEDAIKDLVICGAQINLINDKGVTALSIAVASGNEHVIKLLLDLGADPTITNELNGKVGASVLMQAQDRLYEPLSRELLVYMASIALHLSAYRHSIDDMKHALASGADLMYRDINNQIPLHRAISGKNDVPIDPNRDKAVKFLLNQYANHKLNIHVPDINGKTPYNLCEVYRYTYVTKKQVERKYCEFVAEKFASYKYNVKMFSGNIQGQEKSSNSNNELSVKNSFN